MLQRQADYGPVKFKNEVLGLATQLGDHVVSRAELEACCGTSEMALSAANIPAAARSQLLMGVDWGGVYSRTIAVVGFMDPKFVLQVLRFDAFRPGDHPSAVVNAISQIVRQLGVRVIAADGGGNGHVWNRLLMDRLELRVPLYAMLYGAADGEPRQEGALWKWTVGRTGSLSTVFSRVKHRSVRFPRLSEVSAFLDEVASQIAEYDDEQRSIRFTHPEGQPDDALHALNYLTCLAIRQFYVAQSSM